VRVSQAAQALKQLLARSFHLLPGGIRIKHDDAISHRAATPQSGAEIVDRIRFKTVGDFLYLPQDVLHPVGEPDSFLLYS
jgi:hypothetical protein